jgi:hypothetical protein
MPAGVSAICINFINEHRQTTTCYLQAAGKKTHSNILKRSYFCLIYCVILIKKLVVREVELKWDLNNLRNN